MKVHGGCHCGRITYQASVDPANVSICHCTDCQMLTGSVYRVSVPVRKESFSLLTGEPKPPRKRIWCQSALAWSLNVQEVPYIDRP